MAVPDTALVARTARAFASVLRGDVVADPPTPGSGVRRTVGRLGLGAALAFAGTSHLTTAREEFQAQVPPWFPADPDTVVLVSGVVEIALGCALLAGPGSPTGGHRVDRRRLLRRDLPRQHLPAGHPDRRLRARVGHCTRRPSGRAAAAGALGALVHRCLARAACGGGGGARRAMIVDVPAAGCARRRAADSRRWPVGGRAPDPRRRGARGSTARDPRGERRRRHGGGRGDQGDLLPALPDEGPPRRGVPRDRRRGGTARRHHLARRALRRPRLRSSRPTRTGSRRRSAAPGSAGARSSTPPRSTPTWRTRCVPWPSEHREWLRAAAEELVVELGLPEPRSVAVQLVMLRDGAMATGTGAEPTEVGRALRRAGRAVLDLR